MNRLSLLFAVAVSAFAQCPNEQSVQWAYVPVSGYFLGVNASGAVTINQCSNGALKVLWTAPQFADAEIPAGAIDGKNAAFTLAHVPSAKPVVSLNGLIQQLGGDYTLSGASITFLAKAPAPGDILQVWYRF